MRFRVRRLLGAPVLALLLGLGVTGCSGDQQADEAVDGADNQAAADNDAGGGDNNANAAGADDNGGGGGNAAADDNAAGGDTAAAGDGAKAEGNGTENDLQEIITEMNGQGGDKGGDAGGDGAPAAADGGAPAANPAANAAPAPNAAPANNAAAPAKGADKQAAAEPQSTPLPFQPGGTPAAPGLPEMGSKMAYVVEKGDTLAKISAKVYGSNGRWQEMATLSGIANPSRIFPGDLVYYTLDESAVAFAKAYDSVQRSEEQIKAGDTLATISQRLYGSTTSWRAIWRHNDKIDNPDILPVGKTVYYVPKGALTAAVQKAKAELKLANKSKLHKKPITNNLVTTKVAPKAKTLNVSQISKVSKGIQLAGSQILSQIKTVEMIA